MLLIILVYSCSPKSDYITNFGIFINDVELQSEHYSHDDWAFSDVEFNNYSSIEFMTYKDLLTELEIKQVELYKERYKKQKVKNNPSKEIGKDIMNFLGLD